MEDYETNWNVFQTELEDKAAYREIESYWNDEIMGPDNDFNGSAIKLIKNSSDTFEEQY